MELNGNKNFDAFDYLRSVVTEEALDYVARVAAINVDTDGASFGQFLSAIESEIKTVAVSRKFAVLNTNMIVSTHQRVVSSPTIRAFYFELMTSLRLRITLEMGLNAFEKLVLCFVECYSNPVLQTSAGNQKMVVANSDLRQLAAQMQLQEQDVGEFLKENVWYFGVILCNFYARHLLDQFAILRKQTPEAPKPKQ